MAEKFLRGEGHVAGRNYLLVMSDLLLGNNKFIFAKRLKSKKEIDELYDTGNTVFSKDEKIKAAFVVCDNRENGGLFYTVAVHKKAGNAVWRNRVKRLLREAFWQNKKEIINYCVKRKIILKIIFSPHSINSESNRKLRLDDFVPGMQTILSSLMASV